MSDPMAEIKASFFIECEELLESLQDALSDLDEGADDGETINVVFRAVHSIKGGAGAFGLDALVAFAHRFETVLDELRAGRLDLTPEAVKLFFQAADLLADEIHAAREGSSEPEATEECLQALEALLGDRGPADPADTEDEVEAADFQPMGVALDLDFDFTPEDASPTGFTLQFRPDGALYASGNEPLQLLRALAEIAVVSITTDAEAVPPLDTLDPEENHLSWTVQITGDLTEDEIREVFEFVEDVCQIEISSILDTRETPLPDLPEIDGEPSGVTEEDENLESEAERDTAGSVNPAPPPTNETAEIETEAPARTHDPAPTEQQAEAAKPSAAQPAAANTAPAAEPGATVRVDIERIDRLVNLVGELVINQAMLAQSVAEAGLPPNSAVNTGLEAFMMLTRDIQDSVMMIRAQPVKPLFQRMARIVREASSAIGKDVRLKTEGETTEVDKTVIERLADPLTHMIRNAVDHGLESPEMREAAGKPREGIVTLSAHHRSGRVVIEVSDDGGGIDRKKVFEKAIENGLVTPDAQLSDSEIDNLLFLPGFSTADQVSALSGRGVGMDVVKSSIQSLGGRISITSEPGKGSCFSISLPLTLAVLDGMVVNVAGETLVVPLSSILETATLTSEDIRALGPSTNVIHLRGAFVPLFDLGAELGYRGPKRSYSGDVVLLTAQEDGARSALVVDSILEQRQVVIKGLQQSYGHIPGVAAATILGDGQIALILDPADLVQSASGNTRATDLSLAG
ncbi:chemotaxis protein CheA [Thioclava sp. DLFJ4-1]|uniref:chemotaxis protein CheA n=1 Tax=Thioclava sp. DLFJ4-1 TaxID=1915313 RepID=UPI000997528F|nr:chemotaxis protein CheA [Thioclava sp. DLFJ4-1]OOY16287.1 chemotaxis protein CheA [Thioclava sp. DLFJ4-1]